MPFRERPVIIRGPQYAAIRAFRCESREELLARQQLFLGAGLPGQSARLTRALRKERRAAACGQSYDLARHFALARLCSAGCLRPPHARLTSGPATAPGEEE
jgi:hypothetical protein